MKKLLFVFLAVVLLLAGTVQAQDKPVELPRPGITPDSFLYPAKIFLEDIGTALTFGQQAKARRLNRLVERRVAEIKRVTKEGRSEAAPKALDRYEAQMEKVEAKINEADEKNRDFDRVKAQVASSTSKHLSVLEGVLEKAPEEAKEGIESAIEASTKGHKQALESLSDSKPEQATKIALQEMGRRAERIEREADKEESEDKAEEDGKPERIQKMTQEFEEYASFGQEISRMAQGLSSGTTTVDELVEKATQHHLQVLQSASEMIPEQAREALQKGRQKVQEINQEAQQSRERNEQRQRDKETRMMDTPADRETPDTQEQTEQERERTQEEIDQDLDEIERELKDDSDQKSAADLESACLDSGGEVVTRPCCKSVGDFPNTCTIGACGCAPSESHSVDYCECGEEQCFDGTACVAQSGTLPGSGQ